MLNNLLGRFVSQQHGLQKEPAMTFFTIPHDGTQSTIVNTDQITYLREDNYGTAIHFSSGEHIVCTLGLESLANSLQLNLTGEALLIANA